MAVLTDGQRREIINRLEEAQEADEHLSNRTVASIIGCSASIVSRIKRRVYKTPDPYLLAIRDWLDGAAERQETPAAAYVPTRIGSRILAVCRMAVAGPCIGLVQAASGLGKTTALRAASESAAIAPAGACMIQAGEACCSKRDLLSELAGALTIKPALCRTGRTTYEAIRQRLAGAYAGGRGAPYLLIVDEATTLQPRAVNLLRNLHDEPACRTAVVLADTVARLDGFLHARGNIPGGTEQLSTRARATMRTLTAARQRNGRPDTTDVRAIAEATAQALGHERRLREDTCAYLYRQALKPGAYRNVTALIQNAHDAATQKGWTFACTTRQLDWVAPLSGLQSELTHDAPPFERADGPAEAPRRAAG